MKITFNKTRTKDSSPSRNSVSSLKSISSSSNNNGNGNGSNSPKSHTGLKPGVNSGPASKKPQSNVTQNSSSPNKILNSSSGNHSPLLSTKSSFYRSNSANNISTTKSLKSLSSSYSSSSDSNKKDKHFASNKGNFLFQNLSQFFINRFS